MVSTNMEVMAEQIRQRILASSPKPSVVAGSMPKPVPLGMRRQHYKFPLLLAAIAAGVDSIALVGPAGTGKTTAARDCAKLLGRGFEATSFGPATSKSDLFGLIDGNGVYRDTALVRAARDGKVFLGDELDAGHAGVITGMNMVTANEVFSCPSGMIEKHSEFVAVFGMNTFGTGANRVYVGRNQLDAASLDRMVIIEWDLDPGLEASMLGIDGVASPEFNLGLGGAMSPRMWLARVWTVRKAIQELGVRHIVSPRCSQNGMRLFRAGVGRVHVEEMVLWKGLDQDSRSRIEAKARELTA